MTWMWRYWSFLILEKMFQSSTSWVRMLLYKWLFNLLTTGEKHLSPLENIGAQSHWVYFNYLSCEMSLHCRMYDICCSSYESASLRMFKYGRTEAIRSTTADSLKFVQAMQDPAKQVLLIHLLIIDVNNMYGSDWTVNVANRTQRSCHCCTRLSRHTRRTRTTWASTHASVFLLQHPMHLSLTHSASLFRPFTDKP